jgi:hypothetical protein
MFGVVTPRSRLALLIVAAMAAMSGVLVMGAVLQDGPLAASGVVVGATDGTRALAATPARSSFMPVVDDVGDAWRALLLGAPPAFL